jgi:hypothetical protein
MLTRHRSHLLSTYSTVMQHLADLRQVATTGKSPAGGQVTPLPEPLRGELLSLVDRVSAAAEETVHLLVPDPKQALGEPGGVAAARMWAAVLLGTAEELIEDLRPEVLGRRYGDLDPQEAGILDEEVRQMLALVREAIRLLE